MTQVLLDFKADMNAVDLKHETPLCKAARSGMVAVFEALVNAGAEIEVRDVDNKIAGDAFNSKVRVTAKWSGSCPYNVHIACLRLAENRCHDTVAPQVAGDKNLGSPVSFSRTSHFQRMSKRGAAGPWMGWDGLEVTGDNWFNGDHLGHHRRGFQSLP